MSSSCDYLFCSVMSFHAFHSVVFLRFEVEVDMSEQGGDDGPADGSNDPDDRAGADL